MWMNCQVSQKLALVVIALMIGVLHTHKAAANIFVQIQLLRQSMTIEVDGVHFATWAVSTARPGYRTPIGTYKPYVIEKMHYSKLYDYTPMPYSIFFHRGYAVHGTYEIGSLGRAVSHGCVRLTPNNAKLLFDLISAYGLQNTTIEIVK